MRPLVASCSWMGDALDNALILAAQRHEGRADGVPLRARRRARWLYALHVHDGRGRLTDEIETPGRARPKVNRMRRLEQYSTDADVEQAHRNRKRQHGQLDVGNDGARNSSAIGRDVTHAASQCK